MRKSIKQPTEYATTNKSTIVSIKDREQIADPLTELLRMGGRKLIEQAIEAELQALLS
uniref:hypothetical protein n=1 Tax=Candidatus Vondammii sp. HM_W22 TaxID=2687299 RepID=UPI001F138DCD|nr:hypothetical protein [Candidatus Vondammii sp. HM_W22]